MPIGAPSFYNTQYPLFLCIGIFKQDEGVSADTPSQYLVLLFRLLIQVTLDTLLGSLLKLLAMNLYATDLTVSRQVLIELGAV